MSDLQARLRADLLTARKARDTATTAVLRSTLAAIGNAEAVPLHEGAARGARDGAPASNGPIAGASIGVGATEAARRELTDADVREVIAAEQRERLAAAADLDSRGASASAEQLRAEAQLLAAYV